VLEGIRYEPEDTPIDQMFSQLLSRSMDRERVNEAHPAYPIIIKQLSSDEAKILNSLKSSTYDYVYTLDFDSQRKEFYGHRKVEVDELPRADLSFPENVPFYLEHLHQLGLAGIFDCCIETKSTHGSAIKNPCWNNRAEPNCRSESEVVANTD
jgi:hypothetical protein